MRLMREESVGVIGMGFVGGAVYRGFNLYNEIHGYDVDGKKSPSSWEDVLNCDFVFIAVPTPMTTIEGGECDPTYINRVLGQIAEDDYRKETVFVLKSTVPIGTTRRCVEEFGIENLVHSPEFLTERTADADFITPARHIIGGMSEYAIQSLWMLYEYRFPGVKIHTMGPEEAEMVKYMANCFFATKIMFFNEMRMLTDKAGADWDRVMNGVLSDGRIGISHTDVPGHDGDMGFGGKCFPKDINALMGVMEGFGIDPVVLRAVWEQNKNVRKDWDWAKIDGAVTEKPRIAQPYTDPLDPTSRLGYP
jgi:UDPglucose 6-dehydrogenase